MVELCYAVSGAKRKSASDPPGVWCAATPVFRVAPVDASHSAAATPTPVPHRLALLWRGPEFILRNGGHIVAKGDERANKLQLPTIPTAHWWALRRKFQQSIPGLVTTNYIATVLNMQEESARANVLPGLRLSKLIDDEGRPTERARRWRDDLAYADVCKEIIKDCYPPELTDTVPNPATARDAASRWFANYTGGGEASVKKMVTFYALVSDADLAKANSDKPSIDKGRIKPKAKEARPTSATKQTSTAEPAHSQPDTHRRAPGNDRVPAIHINLQVHISADASTEQIDQVFASMAKHLYKGAE